MSQIKVVITETGRNFLKDEPRTFNEESFYFSTADDVKRFLEDRYGRIPNGRKKVYVDSKDGKTMVVGFLHSFWNEDYSHNSKPWYQTDWISFSTIESTPWDFSQIHKQGG